MRAPAPPPSLRPLAFTLGALGLAVAAQAHAHPYLGLRPDESTLSGPTDPSLAALHYNPAALRLQRGLHLEAHAGATGYLGSYQRTAPLPAGFSGAGSAARPADPADIRWATPAYFIGGSWDLGSESVTLAAAVYAPYQDQTSYDGDPRALSTRYHALRDITYNLWGSAGAALRVTSWLYLAGVFDFGWTRTRKEFLRDPDPVARDGLTCAGGACEAWDRRQEVSLDVGEWGFGFTTGALFNPFPDEQKLWIGVGYKSPLFTREGTQVPLNGFPPEAAAGCATADQVPGGDRGARIVSAEKGQACKGSAQILFSFPHLVHLGGRLRLPGRAATPRAPRHFEVASWLRVAIPPRRDRELRLERRPFAELPLPALHYVPTGQQTAVTAEVDVRQLWDRLILGQALLYESPRAAPEAVSPANLDGHKLDLSGTARLRLTAAGGRSLWLQLSAGATFVLFPGEAGSGFQPDLLLSCRPGYDVTLPACRQVQDGWAQPTAAGRYSLTILHGAAGVELNL